MIKYSPWGQTTSNTFPRSQCAHTEYSNMSYSAWLNFSQSDSAKNNLVFHQQPATSPNLGMTDPSSFRNQVNVTYPRKISLKTLSKLKVPYHPSHLFPGSVCFFHSTCHTLQLFYLQVNFFPSPLLVCKVQVLSILFSELSPEPSTGPGTWQMFKTRVFSLHSQLVCYQ